MNRHLVNAKGELNEGSFTTWTPIGTSENPFRGNFDGNGCTVSGLYINDNGQYKGLFGVLSGAQIRNVYVEDSYIFTSDHAGAVAGYATDGTVISSCHNVNTSIYTKNRSGGIVGWTNKSYVFNCSNAGYCFSNRCSGGIVGDVYSGGQLYNCENIGTVEGNDLVGGISGGTTSADIQNCFNAGEISKGYHIVGVDALPAVVNPFTDCNDIEMLKAYNAGITNGMSKTEFNPDGLLNREQALIIAVRMVNNLK